MDWARPGQSFWVGPGPVNSWDVVHCSHATWKVEVMRPKEKEEKEEEKGRGAADLAVVNGGACGSRLLGCDPRRCYCSCFLLPCAEAPASGFPPPSSASFFFSILCSSLFFFFLSFLSSSVLIVLLKSQNNSPSVFFL